MEVSYPKALDAAYRLLAGRPHTRVELSRKLGRKKYAEDIIAAVLEELAATGYIDEEGTALRWAQSLVREKLWGPLKISAYLAQKGIDRGIIDSVQRRLWQEFDEADIAARAVGKRFSGQDQESVCFKKAAFLRSRGFCGDVVYKISKARCQDQW